MYSDAMRCAVVDCKKPGRPQQCPFDGAHHRHGRIHYDCVEDDSSLTFRSDAWYLICSEHYAVIVEELCSGYYAVIKEEGE